MRIPYSTLGICLALSILFGSCIQLPISMPAQHPTIHSPSTPSIKAFTGDLLNQIYSLEEHMPLAESEVYVVPDETEQAAFASLILSIGRGNLLHAVELADANNYVLVHFSDRGDENVASYLLREKNPIVKGWGFYALREKLANNIIIEAPHPISDKNSDLVALNLYRTLNARALLIAGTHRNANGEKQADVSHVPVSIFQAVHLALLQDSSSLTNTPIVLQIHGFSSDKHPNYPQVVLGFGQKASQAEILYSQNLVDALSTRNIRAGTCAGDSWQDLCGTNNVQGAYAGDMIFIHIEIDETVRSNDSMLVAALVQVFSK